MNYALYLQAGGELALPQVEKRLGEKEVNLLVERIIAGDQDAAKVFIENAIADPENDWINDAISGAMTAAEQGNQNAIKFLKIINPLLEQLQGLVPSQKDGGKVKKAKCGKKMEKGAKVPVEKKGGCPCQYHKVGGKLHLVDCNGNIIK